MIYINKYTILLTTTFKKELEKIIYYFKYTLNEPFISTRFYKNVINEINSLEFMPKRYKKIEGFYDKTRVLRKKLVNNYVIVYEVNDNTRTSFYLTYFS